MATFFEAGYEAVLVGNLPIIAEAGYEVVLFGQEPSIVEAGFEVILTSTPSRPNWHPSYIYDTSFGWVPLFPPELLTLYPPREE